MRGRGGGTCSGGRMVHDSDHQDGDGEVTMVTMIRSHHRLVLFTHTVLQGFAIVHS